VKQEPDVLVLDGMMPHLDGLTACRAIRQVSQVLILLLTARHTVQDRVTGLDAGADDHLVKPFAVVELVARARQGNARLIEERLACCCRRRPGRPPTAVSARWSARLSAVRGRHALVDAAPCSRPRTGRREADARTLTERLRVLAGRHHDEVEVDVEPLQGSGAAGDVAGGCRGSAPSSPRAST
jgi:CheY-like chemotaxis protein